MTRTNRGEKLEHLGQQGHQVSEAIRGGHENDHSDVELPDLLLMLEILVGCEEDVELRSGQAE